VREDQKAWASLHAGRGDGQLSSRRGVAASRLFLLRLRAPPLSSSGMETKTSKAVLLGGLYGLGVSTPVARTQRRRNARWRRKHWHVRFLRL
jgi:hypothetical protein